MLAITAVAGLLYGTRGLYTPDPATLPTFLGQDGITLVVILPLLLGSVWATRRGSLRGLLLWTAALFYLAYSYAYYVLSPEFNVLYLAYIGIVAMSLYGCLYLLISTDAQAVAARFSARTPVRVASAFLMTLSLGLGLAWVSMIVSHLTSGATPSRVSQVVWPMDLVVAFPAMFWGGVWLWRRQPLGYAVATVLLIKGGLLGLTLVVNTWLASTWGRRPGGAGPAIGGLGGVAPAAVPPQSARDRRRCVPEASAPDEVARRGRSDAHLAAADPYARSHRASFMKPPRPQAHSGRSENCRSSTPRCSPPAAASTVLAAIGGPRVCGGPPVAVAPAPPTRRARPARRRPVPEPAYVTRAIMVRAPPRRSSAAQQRVRARGFYTYDG